MFVKTAIVNYRSPKTLKDHIRQNTRFRASPIRMKKYFPGNLVEKEVFVPMSLFLSSMLKQFIRHPILTLSIFIINKYCAWRAAIVEKRLTAKWDMANTTKSFD